MTMPQWHGRTGLPNQARTFGLRVPVVSHVFAVGAPSDGNRWSRFRPTRLARGLP